jgi:hypothetical protein
MTFSKEIKGSLGVILNPVLPIIKPFDLNFITLFQSQEHLGMIPNLNRISYTHYTLLNIQKLHRYKVNDPRSSN